MIHFFVKISVYFLGISSILFASLPSKYEIEPNDRAVNATVFRGSKTLLGTLKPNEKDHFLWKVSSKDSSYSWDWLVMPNADVAVEIEVSKVVFQKAGLSTVSFSKQAKELKSKKLLFTFSNSNTHKIKKLSQMLFDKGEYLIAIHAKNQEKALDYKIQVIKKDKVYTHAGKSQSKARNIYLGNNTYIYDSIGDDAWFSFEVGEENANKLWEIKSASMMGSTDKLTLYKDAKKIKELHFDKYAKVIVKDLELSEGKYSIHLAKPKAMQEKISVGDALAFASPKESNTQKTHYALTVYTTGLQSIDKEEIEPNNDWSEANTFHVNKIIHARLNEDDNSDYYKFYLPKTFTNTFLDITLKSASKDIEFTLYNAQREVLQSKQVDANYTMRGLQLESLQYYYLNIYSYKKLNTKYSIAFSSPNKTSNNDEIEPNDHIKNASFIETTASIKGDFLGQEDDCYLFNVSKSNHFWSIEASGKNLNGIYLYQQNKEILQSKDKDKDTLIFSKLFLLRGEYGLCLYGKNASYHFNIKSHSFEDMNISSLDDFEHEPNQEESQANFLAFNKTKQGVLERKDNEDYFYFTLKNTEHIRLTAIPATKSNINIKLMSDNFVQKNYPKEGNTSVIEGVYPAGKYVIDLFTYAPSYGRYTLLLERLNPFESETIHENDFLTLSLDHKALEVASFYPKGQSLSFQCYITSHTEENITIETHASDKTWKVETKTKNIHLQKEIQKSIDFTVKVPKNVEKSKVFVTLKVANASGEFQTITLVLESKEDIIPQHTFQDWGVEEKFLGTLNVARVDLGAKRILEHNESKEGIVEGIGKNYHYLFDDITYGGYGFYLEYGRNYADENVSIDLVGDAPVEVMGISLNPKGYKDRNKMLKDFSISLSKDGKVYQKVYEGTLDNRPKEQFFAFDKSYKASYAKLTLHNNHEDKSKGEITLGEWKVFAKQTSLAHLQAFNIANPKLGGHIVKASKTLSPSWDRAVLTHKEESSAKYYEKGEKISFVLGFKHERMAKITSMQYTEAKESKKSTRFADMKIEVSTQTPNGSWQKYATWKREKSLENNSSIYTFNTPQWARYIRFTSTIKEKGYYYPPEILAVYEAVNTKNYISILNQWEDNSHQAFYEYKKKQKQSIENIIRDNDRKITAYTLEDNQSIKGEVSVAKKQKDWYKIRIAKGKNTLSIVLSNDESVEVSAILIDENNTRIKALNIEKSPLTHRLNFAVSEGIYYLKIKQPPISVVFAWDNSASVSPYSKQIFSAVHHYVNGIQKDIDRVNLLCFNTSIQSAFLLDDFSEKPREVETILNNFDNDCSSSDAEEALVFASKKLAHQDGIKGIIIIADADGNRKEALWSHLEAVNPKIFSIRVSSTYERSVFEGLMHSWSRVNNGTYAVVENSTQMSKEINHAMHILRRPVQYTLTSHTNYIRPLDDGRLKILADKNISHKKKKIDKSFAIELILDASGSMLKRIKGKRRIEIAKEVLISAVEKSIPPKTLVALRVFGHKKVDACRTDLEMKLQPLHVKKTSKLIKRIKAKNLAKTPIAHSLAKVASDLKDVKGKRVIILVTDGKETCEGNASKEIEKLKALGIEVRLNIIGLAIDDEALKKEFESWAKLGNGEYFDANDKKSLDEAVKKALEVPYLVYDLENTLVAKGMVGDKGLKLQGGEYKVTIESYPKQVYDKVKIIGEKETTITINKGNNNAK